MSGMIGFRGAITALVTPFKNGKVDTDAIISLVNWQIEQGIDGLLACGCTGEAATLSFEEHILVVRTVLDAADGRVPVIAGSGKNDTASTLELSREIDSMNVDALLLITPYYNKPGPPGQIAHYSAVADAVSSPVLMYNVPGRTGMNMTPETISDLVNRKPGIIGVKDAAGSAERVTAIHTLNREVLILSGDDPIAMAQVALGAAGVISVVSNIAPAAMSVLISQTQKGDLESARKIQNRLYQVIKAMFIETNPIPVKQALAMMGRIKNELRLPLTPMQEKNLPELEKTLRKADLL